MLCLESKDLVNKLADGAGFLEAKALSGLLETANHRRRATEKNLDIVGRLGEVFLNQGQLVEIPKPRARVLTSIMSAVT